MAVSRKRRCRLCACDTRAARLAGTSRRLPRSRILMFLARLLPLSDRSGLNPAGVYNLSNVTPVEDVEEVRGARCFNSCAQENLR